MRGLLALEEGPRIDFDALRLARRARVVDMMDEREIDVLMCTRQGNARYIVGHRPLWRAVITPWAPMVTFVRPTLGIHLLAATWDDGLPADIPYENLNALTWNASNTVNAIRNIAGLADAKRIAVDGMQPGLAKLLGMLAPGAELVDGEAEMRRLRAVKLPAEIECLRTAIAMAEGALTSVADSLQPGTTELELKGRFQEAVCAYGINHPTYEGTFCATPRAGAADAPPLRRIPTARPVGAGELVAMMGSVHYAGYEGVAGRTHPALGPSGAVTRAQQSLARRLRDAHDAVVAECTPGTSPSALAAAWTTSGEPLPPVPVAYGIGLGVEAPIVDDRPVHLDEPLLAGTVLVVQGYVWEPGVGGVFAADTVHVTDDGPERLTRLSHSPFGHEPTDGA
jgi:Xaa-Pro aminopeptidase